MKQLLTPSELRRIKRVGAHVVRIEPYGCQVVVFTCLDALSADLSFVFPGSPGIEQSEIGDGIYGLSFFANSEHGQLSCIAFNADKYREETIWHEALHTTVDVLNAYGVLFTPDNHEPFAYTQGYLVSQIRSKVYGLPEFGYDD